MTDTRNPLRLLREAAGETVSSMAELAGVTTQLVIWNEQGVYASPSPRYLQQLLEYSPAGDYHTSPDALTRDYYAFQKLTRESNYGKLLEPHDWSDYPWRHHPFVAWRKASGLDSRVAISKLYCVAPSLIFKFEKQPERCKTPPGELRQALLDSGYRADTLDALAIAYEEHRKYLRSTT